MCCAICSEVVIERKENIQGDVLSKTNITTAPSDAHGSRSERLSAARQTADRRVRARLTLRLRIGLEWRRARQLAQAARDLLGQQPVDHRLVHLAR